MFRRIDHVEIIPVDLEKTLDFYCRILGFKTKQRQPGRPGSPWKEIVFLTLNDSMLEVLEPNKPAPTEAEPNHVGYRMMAIEVGNMDAALEHLKREGVEVSRPPTVGNPGRAEIKDPSGVTIELRQW